MTINPVLDMETLLWVSNDGTYDYDGPVASFCDGAPSAQKQLAAAQTAEYTQETAEQNELFTQDEALNNEIKSVYGPIFAAGPSQLGFSQGQLTNLQSEASTGTGEAYQAASQAEKEALGTEGGGNVQLPSGVSIKAGESIATAGAQQLSGEEGQIENADYAQGNANFNAASNALESVGTVFNPAIGEGSVANQGGAAANSTEQDIAQENEAPLGAALGALGAVAGAAGTAYAGK